MFKKSRFTLVAAFVLGSASAALAQSGEEIQNSAYQLNPNASVPLYTQSIPQPQAPLIEGRNVSAPTDAATQPSRDRLQSFGGY